MNFGYKRLYIDGELRDAERGRRVAVICPGTEEAVAEIAWAGRAEAEAALASAARGFKVWSRLSLKERSRWMYALREAVIAHEELLRECVMYEMGKPWEATAEDYETVVHSLDWYAQEMMRTRDLILPDVEDTHRHMVISQPVGVVAAFLAWNFPLLNVGFKLGPALAAGCSIILRPSSSSPLSAYVLGEICHQVGLPAGVVNILCGPAEEVAETISRSSIPRLVTMIGSSETGRRLIAQSASSIKRMSMELGGNAPALVFPDAPMEAAVEDLATLKFGNCGQVCVSPNRIFIHEEAYEEFERRFVDRARAVRVGFGRDNRPSMGPLINGAARERVHSLVQDAVQQGAKILCGGRVPPELPKGYFYEPTVLADVHPKMRVFREEIFGPIAPLIRFREEADVIAQANDTEYGLVAYVYTRDVDRVRRLAEELEYGEVMINGFKYSISLPHGGIKESGVGKDCSQWALEDYLVKKRITIKCGGGSA